ncbi:plasmid mobilization protein [Methylocucumis oryzae]|uniref:Uncharacterized protein n=1 Tax=Methylocucumis oryzae TaxID=1632867 RepID=A0A0F3IDX4_9GAMM|nr:plasmid mobilization relaxosome protein MobC [Methylocucumis oryzae]KJV04966.1 hypothetical protein VZ94_21655 [Methylocucumis oryzae]
MSTSDKRKRCKTVQVRLSPTELEQATASAEAVGLSLSGYVRTLLLGRVTDGTQRRAAKDAQDLARLHAQLGKVGGNLNQLTKLANQGQLVPPSVLAACLAEVREVKTQIAEALSRDY